MNIVVGHFNNYKERRDLQYLFIFALVLRLCYLMLMMGQLDLLYMHLLFLLLILNQII